MLIPEAATGSDGNDYIILRGPRHIDDIPEEGLAPSAGDPRPADPCPRGAAPRRVDVRLAQ